MKWLFLILVFLTSCTQQWDSYLIATRWLPESLNPWTETRNGTHVYYSSLYYPLFKRQGLVLQSEFLDLERTHALSETLESFQLCLKSNLTFSDGSPIHTRDLENAIRHAHHMLWFLPSIRKLTATNNCLSIQLNGSAPSYFDQLSSRRATILKSESIAAPVPIGLGPYTLRTLQKDRLILEANGNHVPGHLKRLEWRLFELASVDAEFLSTIDDWNYYVDPELPENLTRDFSAIHKALPITSILSVIHPDKERRQKFFECFDRKGYIAAIKLDVAPRNTLFPAGLLEAANRPLPKSTGCHFSGPRPEIVYYNSNGPVEWVEKFFREKASTLPFHVRVQETSTDDEYYGELVHRPGIYMGSYDSENPIPENFLIRMSPPAWPAKSEIPGLRKKLLGALAERNLEKREKLLILAHDYALSSGYVIPLGQMQMTYYFRPDLTNIEVANSGNGVPLMHLMTRKLSVDAMLSAIPFFPTSFFRN